MHRQSYSREPRQNREPDPIEQLSALSSIFSSLQGQQQQAQNSQRQNALALLGLLQQGQHQDAQLALQGKEADNLNDYRKGELSANQDARNLTASQAAAQLGMQNTWHQQGLSAEQDARNLTATNDAAKMDLQNQALQNELAHQKVMEKAAFLGHATSIPGQTPTGFVNMAAALGYPDADNIVKANHDALVTAGIAQAKQAFAPAYSSFASKGPKVGQPALNSIWQQYPQMQDPNIQSGMQDWLSQQNAALYHPQGGEAGAGTLGNREGGILPPIGHALSWLLDGNKFNTPQPAVTPPGSDARLNEMLDDPYSPISLLFGTKKK